ncbi:hypothetical protein AB0D38_03835 [Streptomyces sp. NPDC048279]|uniref:hypothetical protein n=1 Tax=Streptomyces sp. NPDC048279 TaxID=3154714 RepID=UPI003434B147
MGVKRTKLLHHPDGVLTGIPLQGLSGHGQHYARLDNAEACVLDYGGITGDPDHRHATAAALAAADCDDRTVIAWTRPLHTVQRLNTELGTAFVSRPPEENDVALHFNRAPQLTIACHAGRGSVQPYRPLAGPRSAAALRATGLEGLCTGRVTR